MAIVLESTNTAAVVVSVVGVSNLDAAVAQSKAAAAHIAAAAAAIRQLPNVDVVTDRVSDSAGALAIHASVSADIRETVRRAIDSSRLTLELAGHTFGARFAIATLEARLAGLPVALGHEEASALRDYAGALMPGDDEFPPEDALPPSYRGPAINLAGHVIDVFNSADVCSWDGVRIVVTDA